MKYLLLLTLLLPGNALALSCVEPKLENFAANSKYIVHGKISKIVRQSEGNNFSRKNPDKYRITIIEMLKGNTELKVVDLEIGTWMGNPRYQLNDEYIFFSNKLTPVNSGPCALVYGGEDLAKHKAEIRKFLTQK